MTAATAAEGLTVTQVAASLDNPSALAVRPPSKQNPEVQLAIACEKSIVLWDSESQSTREYVGAASDAFAGARPSGLTYFDPAKLLVAWKSAADRHVGLSLYEADAEEKAKQILERPLSEERLPGDQPLRGLKFTHQYALASQGDKILRARTALGSLFQFRVVRESLPSAACAYTVTPEGYLLTGCDGRLAFYDPSEASSPARMEMASGLKQVHALAYSPLPRPAERRLYALGGADSEEAETGVYRLDATQDAQGRLGCQPVLIHPLAAPSAMAFDAGGILYVLSGDELIRIEGEL